MSDSPESVVRKFLAAWSHPKADELRAFLSEDAVWVDGPQGVRRGANTIVDELTRQLALGRDHTLVIDTLVADGPIVMVEWHGTFTLRSSWRPNPTWDLAGEPWQIAAPLGHHPSSRPPSIDATSLSAASTACA